MIADDLFAGAGGWDLAAQWLGIRARGVENMRAARATRAAAGLETIHDDVWTYVPDGAARLELAGPPCQTFSQSGSGSGRKALNNVLMLIPFVADMTLEELRRAGLRLGDDRTALVLTPLWFALHHQSYREIAWEQVPPVQPVWDACAVELRHHGWNVVTGRVQSEQFGVPQTRRRAVLLGSRDAEVGLPAPTHSLYHNRTPERLDPGVARWCSIADALGVWETQINNQSGTTYNLEEQLSYPAAVIAGRGLVGFRGANANRFNGATKSRNDGIRLTVSQAGTLQSFPPDYPWQGGPGEQYLQVGNAIPPLLAMALLSAIYPERGIF